MCTHTPVQCSFFWYIMLICTSCGMRFLTRVDVQTRACRTVTPSGNLLHLVHIVHACHFWIAADIIIPLSRVHVFHPDALLIRWATHWSIRWDIFTQTVTYIGHELRVYAQWAAALVHIRQNVVDMCITPLFCCGGIFFIATMHMVCLKHVF